MDKKASPCVRHCCLDDNDICLGCFRSLEEIKQWQALSEKQKQMVLAAASRKIKAKRRS